MPWALLVWRLLSVAPDDERVASNSAIAVEIGHRIAEVRTRLTLSRKELGQLADMDESSVGRMERGGHEQSIAALIRVAGALDIDIAVLTRGLDRATYLPGEAFPPSATEYLRARGPAKPPRRRRS